MQNNNSRSLFKACLLALCSLSVSACVVEDIERHSPTQSSSHSTSTKPTVNTSTTATTSERPDLFQGQCLSQFYQDTAPELINQKLKKQSYALCLHGLTLMYSGVSKTPIWVAEQLTPERLDLKVKRDDQFHEETRLPKAARATLADYRNSGFDRGHMAPNGDMYSRQSQYDSFSLANIAPQHPVNNQNTWRDIEEATRAMVSRYREPAFVVTGVTYLNPTVRTLPNSQVLIPSHLYKAVYFPKSGRIGAYFSANDDSRTAEVLSICQLEKRIGISIFPALDANTKARRDDFPRSAKQVQKNRALHHSFTRTTDCADPIPLQQRENTKQRFLNQQSQAQQRMFFLKHDETASTPLKQELTIRFLQWLKDHA